MKEKPKPRPRKQIDKSKSFWQTLPGIITALAALITAIAGCIGVLLSNPKTSEILFSSTNTPSATNTSTLPENTSAQTPEMPNAKASNKDGMELIFVSSGNFEMGSNNVYDNGNSIHTVYLDAFWIDQTEITNKMYAQCVADNNSCKSPVFVNSSTRSNYYTDSNFQNYPVIYVSWNDANAYCHWASRRLPTEAEWEKAARGLDGRIYPWGNINPKSDLLNFGNNVSDTTQVGDYPLGKSPYGVLDMAGNVYEWVADWYTDNIIEQSSLNPTGPFSGTVRVMRGGSWTNSNSDARSTHRTWAEPDKSFDNAGFRCAISQPLRQTP